MGTKTVIYDFGANAGGNIPYYLEKADLVVAVEANPALCRAIEDRFPAEVAAGRLAIENVVIVAERGLTETPFFMHRANNVLSQLPRPSPRRADEFTKVVLPARHVVDIVARYGPPHYIKIDIEHSDAVILRELLGHGITPDYISAEAHDVDVFRLLVAVGGYNAFKLVDGATVQDVFAAHEIATRGGRKPHAFPRHSAGPFGNDIPGPWRDRQTFFQHLGQVGLGWKDIHASRVDGPGQRSPTPPTSGTVVHPSAAARAQVAPPRHGVLRGEFLVTADPLVFMTKSWDRIVSPAIDRSIRYRSPESVRQEATAARGLPQTVHDEPALILSCAWDEAFYHFLYEALGKLAVAELHGVTPADHAVYFNATHAWQLEALQLLGVEPRPLPGGTVHRFTQGVIPTYPSIPWSRPTPESIRFLRRLRVPAANALPGCKLFVSRGAQCADRRLDNETEIYDRCFRRLGYEFVDPGRLPFDEQRLLFSRATHVAGAHGAALSLLCLGRLPLSVIELHSPHYYTACFRCAAAAVGARHAAFNARREGFKPATWRANFTLDAGAVGDWLATLPPGMT